MDTAILTTAPSSSGTPVDPSHLSTTGQGLSVQSGSSPASPAKAAPRKRFRTPKLPKNRKVYKVAMAAIALRAQGANAKTIAETLGYPEATIRSYLYLAHKNGLINISSFTDPDDQLDVVLRSKTVRNVNEFLDDRDKDVTIEAAKGLGMFKTHQVVKGDQTSNVGVALRVQVELPPNIGPTAIVVRPGTVGGERGTDVPLDAEIIESLEESHG